MKNKVFPKVFLLISVIAISLSSLTGCYLPFISLLYGTDSSEYDMELVGDAEILFEYNEETKCYDVRIEGIAMNSSGKALSGAYVTFALFDADGNTIGTAEDYINTVEDGSTWRFCAVGSCYYEPSDFTLTELCGYYW